MLPILNLLSAAPVLQENSAGRHLRHGAHVHGHDHDRVHEPTIPGPVSCDLFQRIRSRVSLPLHTTIFARRSQRRQLKPGPTFAPASYARRGRAHGAGSGVAGAGGAAAGATEPFSRGRRHPTAMSRTSRSALPSAVLLALLLLLPRVHSGRRSRCRRIAWRGSPVLVRRGRRWRVLIRVVARR
jgi:hypothetical protein